MALKNYISPSIEILEIEIEDAVLADSGYSFSTSGVESEMDMTYGGGF